MPVLKVKNFSKTIRNNSPRKQGSVFFLPTDRLEFTSARRGNGMCNWGKVGQIAVVRRVAVRRRSNGRDPYEGMPRRRHKQRESEREKEREEYNGSCDKENFTSYSRFVKIIQLILFDQIVVEI